MSNEFLQQPTLEESLVALNEVIGAGPRDDVAVEAARQLLRPEIDKALKKHVKRLWRDAGNRLASFDEPSLVGGLVRELTPAVADEPDGACIPTVRV
jgi:hypothetical protein